MLHVVLWCFRNAGQVAAAPDPGRGGDSCVPTACQRVSAVKSLFLPSCLMSQQHASVFRGQKDKHTHCYIETQVAGQAGQVSPSHS